MFVVAYASILVFLSKSRYIENLYIITQFFCAIINDSFEYDADDA